MTLLTKLLIAYLVLGLIIGLRKIDKTNFVDDTLGYVLRVVVYMVGYPVFLAAEYLYF